MQHEKNTFFYFLYTIFYFTVLVWRKEVDFQFFFPSNQNKIKAICEFSKQATFLENENNLEIIFLLESW